MKKYLAILMMAVMPLFVFQSCGSDDHSDLDDGAAVAGVYTGKLLYGTTVVEDAYVVHINRVSSSVVSVSADFLSGSMNFNVEKVKDNIYNLISETSYGINIVVSGSTLTINYQTKSDYIFTFQGVKD